MRALILKLKQVTNQMKRVHKDTVIQGSLENLVKVDSIEQFSVWRTTVLAKENFNRNDGSKAGEELGIPPSSHTMQVYLCPPTIDRELLGADSAPIKLEFFLRKYEKCVGVDDEDDNNTSFSLVTVSKGYSLWMRVERDNRDDSQNNQQNEIILSVKVKKTVNGEDKENSVPIHGNVVVLSTRNQGEQGYPNEFLLNDNFLVLGFQQRNMKDGKVRKNVSLLGDLIKVRVDFAVKTLYASENIGDENDWGEMRQVTLKGKEEGISYLVKDLKRIYTGEILTDVFLKASDGMVVKAHKVILAARSPYFCRLIQWNPSSFSNKSTVPFPIDIVAGRPLLAVVHWMYTGELLEDVGLDNAVLEVVIKAARQFEMCDLLKVLEKRRNLCGESQCSSCSGAKNDGNRNGKNQLSTKSSCKDAVKKIKRAVLAWFPLLRYRFGNRQVGLVASIINAIYGIYELV